MTVPPTSGIPTLTFPALTFPAGAYAEMIACAYSAYPLEACGLLAGIGTDVHRFVPCTNEAASAKVYAIPGKELLCAERAAEDDGLEILGVFHSHTHSEPYPSPTDVAQAPDPGWQYVIVSLKRESPEARCWRIDPAAAAGQQIVEVPISVTPLQS